MGDVVDGEVVGALFDAPASGEFTGPAFFRMLWREDFEFSSELFFGDTATGAAAVGDGPPASDAPVILRVSEGFFDWSPAVGPLSFSKLLFDAVLDVFFGSKPDVGVFFMAELRFAGAPAG